MSPKKIKRRPIFLLSVICLIFIKHQPFLYLIVILSGFSICIETVGAPATTNGIFATEHCAEVYGFFNLFPDMGYTLGGPLIAPTYDMTGSYNTAWTIAAVLFIVMATFPLYSYRGSRIYIKGQEEVGNTARI